MKKAKKIIVITISIILVLLLGIITYNVLLSPNLPKKEIQLEEVETPKDFLYYLKTNNKDENVTYEILTETSEYIMINKYEKDELIGIVSFHKENKEIKEGQADQIGMVGN